VSSHRTLQRIVALLVIVSLSLSPAAPIAQAQEGGATYLPLIASARQPLNPSTSLLFRTQVTVKTSAQWRDLARLGVTILQQGDDWALLLVDDDQLESLAAWRFNPDRTADLGGLAAANGLSDASLDALLAQAAAVQQLVAAETNVDAASLDAARADLRAAMHSLPAAVQARLVAADESDRDHDGLTDTQEAWWCTNADNYDSDSDGTSDGAEVAKLKAWMSHQLALPPIDTAQPFNGWPFDNISCIDNDRDSVPNLAERWELGLNMNIESTDRDRYDDGQEVYGTTYCPGSGNACGYGQLPSANHDGILLFPQLPSWVTAPGNHPLAAAFPKVEIEVIPDVMTGKTFQMRLATVLTTDERHEEGETKSYSTTKTEGTSTSNAETETWEDWQEVSRTDAASVQVASVEGTSNSTVNIIESTNINTTNVMQNLTQMTVNLSKTAKSIPHVYLAGKATEAADFALGEVCAEIHCKRYAGAAIRTAIRAPVAAWDQYQKNVKSNQCEQGLLGTLKCAWSATASAVKMTWEQKLDEATKAEQEAHGQVAGTDYTAGSGMLDSQKIYPISYPMPSFVPTVTNTSGSSRGGARTTTHTQYEEHSVTEGNTKQFGRSWGTATAENTVHTADLWFSYQVRNGGTDYARSICNVAFNIFIGSLDVPAVTYFPAADFGGNGCLSNFRPGEAHKYTFPTQSRIALTIDQVKAIDLGEPVHITAEDMSLGQDDYYADDAVLHDMTFSMEDGTDDGDELIDAYLIPTWTPGETVLNVLARYFPHTTDANGMMTAIWTPEYRSDNPAWCQAGWRPSDYPAKVLWCKHELSTAEWWNVYTDGLGDGGEGFQDTPAAPGAVALFRFNQDSDLDGFSDRSEQRLGTDPNDASSFPQPEVLAGVHNIKVGSRVTSTLSLLNTGFYDAYGVEAVMVAPDDSISITNNTVGGSGRVRAQKQVIVGSRIVMQSPLPAPWTQANHAVPAVGGYYTGPVDRTYTFSVANCPVGGCTVGSGTWTLNWSDGKGATGSLNFGAGYASPTFLPVGAFGVALALYTGNVQNGEGFAVAANTPRDTFQYTINRTPHTEPLVIVSYNDPQGNHRFVVPSQAMSLTAPTDNLQLFGGQMLDDVGVEIVTDQPFAPGSNMLKLLVNNPSDKTLVDAHLFLEFINISGTVVSEVPTQVTLPPGPTYTPVTWSSADFDPAFDPDQDYIVMTFLTDYQGNILDTAGRPLSSFQEDPLPKVAADPAALTWDFGSAAQGSLLKHPLALANVGHGALYAYMQPAPGLHLSRAVNASVGAADQNDFELTLHTAEVDVGAYDQTVTIHTSDPLSPTLAVRVLGQVTAASGDTTGGSSRPLDVPVTVQGPKNPGDWVEFVHTLGPEPQSLHPVKVFDAIGSFVGLGKYAADFRGSEPGGTQTPGWWDSNFRYRRAIVIPGSSTRPSGSYIGITGINLDTTIDSGKIRADKGDLRVVRKVDSTTWQNLSRNVYTPWHTEFILPSPYVPGPTSEYYLYYGNTSAGSPSTFSVTQGWWVDMYRDKWWSEYAGTWTHNEPINFDDVCGGSLNHRDRVGSTFDESDKFRGRIFIPSTGVWTFRVYTNDGYYLRINDITIGSYSGYNGPTWSVIGSIYLTAGWNRVEAGNMWVNCGPYKLAMEGPGFSNQIVPASYYQRLWDNMVPGASIGIEEQESIVEQIELTPFNSAKLLVPVSIPTTKVFVIQYARRLTFNASGVQTPNLRIPAGMLTTATLDALVSQLPANASFSLDIGNDGSNEWTATVANNSANASPNLAAAFNAYWQSHGAPTTGTLDVPVKVTLSQAGQVLLSNLQISTAGSKLRAVRLPAQNYSTVNLDFAVGGSGANPLTVALDVGGDGSIEWSGSAESLPVALKTGNLAAAVNTYLATLPPPLGGVGGGYDVPLRIHVSPDAPITLNDFATSVAVATDLTANAINVLPVGQASSLTSAANEIWAANASALSSYRAGDIAPVAATLGNTGNRDSGPVTAAFFATAEGWGDWYIGSDFFANIPAGGSVQAEILWDTTGFSGTTPVKVVVNPYGRVVESDSGDNVKTTSVYIEPPPLPPVASFLWSPNAGPFPLTVVFTDTSEGEIDSWQWDFGDGATSTARHPTHTYTAAGLYTVTLTVVGPLASDTAVRANAIAVSVPPPPVANFSASATAGSAPLSVQFMDQSDGLITSRLWSFGDGATSTEVSPSHTYVASGNYTATLTVTGPGGVDSHSVGITVSPAQVSVSIPLAVGWNLISLPNVAANTPVESVFAPIAGKFNIVFAYRGCDAADPWKKYDPAAPSFSNDLKTVDNTLGLWIKMTQVATLTVVGPPPAGGSIPLCEGWNLAGAPSLQTTPPVTLFSSIIAGCYSIVFAYKATDVADVWKKYDPAAPAFSNDLKQVEPGMGLWIKATQACTWTVSGP
jgi:PKD repeat protein